MPDIDGGKEYELQCLNDPGGLRDMTFAGQDVPDYIARVVRVQPPGRAWGLAGYSEGGYCAANIALLAKVPLLIVPGGHQGSVWRAALGPMLTWMTPQLAEQAATAAGAAAATQQGARGAATPSK